MTISNHQIIYEMQRYGGSFIKALALAWIAADWENKTKLQNAFPEYWAEYAKVAERREEALSQPEDLDE